MLLEISEGEILDRLSILEIKNTIIKHEQKKREIENELAIYSTIIPIKNKYIYLYKLIYFVNKMIWDLTDNVKAMMNRDKEYADIAFQIFELNQQRFRIKNIINQCENSTIKEQKSYESKTIHILLDDLIYTNEINSKLLYLYLLYDNIKLYYKSDKYINILEQYIPNIEYYKYSSNCEYFDISLQIIPEHYATYLNTLLDK